MKKLPPNEIKKNRVYRASDIEENKIKELYKIFKVQFKKRFPKEKVPSCSRWKVQKLLVDKA